MNRLKQILRALGRAVNRAPQWVQKLVTVLVAATAAVAAVIMIAAVKDAGYRQGFVPGQSAGYAEGYAAGERRESRRNRGVVEVDMLPAGVDREAAARAEEAGEAFAFLSPRPEVGCTVLLRLPFPKVVGVPDAVTEVGLGLDTRHWQCDAPMNERLPGYKAPTVADRQQRWERSIIGGDIFTYRVGDSVRVDTDRCTGFVIPLPVPAGGVAVPASPPSVSRSSVCGNKPR